VKWKTKNQMWVTNGKGKNGVDSKATSVGDNQRRKSKTLKSLRPLRASLENEDVWGSG
jgi:hypothetical protein